jgi:hypothetical protein
MNRRQLVFLAIVTSAAAFLRLRGLGVPSFWLDEIIHYDVTSAAMRQPWHKWLLPFDHENGQLFYLLQTLFRWTHPAEAAARIAPALIGIASVPLAWFAARRRDGDSPAPYVFAILLAFSPLHVYYSREGRPYALIMLLAILFIGGWAVGAAIAAVFTAAAAGPLVASAAVAYIDRRRVALVALTCSATIAMLFTRAGVENLKTFPALDGRFWRELIESFSAAAIDMSRLHLVAYVFLALAIAGAVDLFRRDRAGAWIAISLTVLPVFFMLAALWLREHRYAIRYLAPALPGYLFLASLGVRRLAAAFKRLPGAATVLAIALVIPGLRSAWTEPYRKLDWRNIAESLRQRVQTWDVLLLTNDWSEVSLGYYLRERPLTVNWINVHESVAAADKLMKDKPRAWIIVSGYYMDPAIVEWAKRYPLVEVRDLENFRLYKSP